MREERHRYVARRDVCPQGSAMSAALPRSEYEHGTLPFLTTRATPLVPTLLALCIDVLAAEPHVLTPGALAGLGEQLSAHLLARILSRGKLDFVVARTFLQSGHAGIAEALREVDLLAGLVGAAHTPCRPR